jgi:ATP-dependent RNA helicase SUPV3L1/SUV3
VLKPRARALAQAFVAGEAFRPRAEGLTVLPEPSPSPRALSSHGLRAIGRVAVPVETLERLADHRRAAGKADLPDTTLSDLGWTAAEAKAILVALRVPRAKRPDRPDRPTTLHKDSPFAALAALTAPPEPARRKRPRRHKARAAP